MTEFAQPVPNTVAAGAGRENDLAFVDADGLGVNDLIGRPLFQNAVLMNARRMRECIGPDNGFVRLH